MQGTPARNRVILGLTNEGVDTSAALLVAGQVQFAVAEERLIREKRTRRFPINAIRACLRHAGLRPRDVDLVTVGWNPLRNMERLGRGQFDGIRYLPEMLYRFPGRLSELAASPDDQANLTINQHLDFGDAQVEVRYVDHHLAHAGLAFFASPFDRAGILTIDGFGEKITTMLAVGEGGRIRVLETVEFPHSVGMFYETVTQFLGFEPDNDEWKVMGASAYGNPTRFMPQMRQLMRATDEGLFELNLPYFQYYLFSRRTHYHPRIGALLGAPVEPGTDLGEREYDIAAAAQAVVEEVAFHALTRLHRLTGCTDLCVAGGVAMNCVLNGKIAGRTPFTRVFVPSAPEDMGTSLGSALYTAFSETGGCPWRMESNYFGPAFTDADIRAELERYKLEYREVENPAAYAAQRLAEGQIVGWFQGGLEFGQRALGNRSILGDPRDPRMKDRINLAVKYREPFRPFAPSVQVEHAHELLEDACVVPFMDKVLKVRPAASAIIPAVTHVDGSTRPHTVSRDQNPLFWELLEQFRRQTGVPAVLNTSFNIKGEPIVCSPADALRTYFTCGLDELVIGRFVVRKRGWESASPAR